MHNHGESCWDIATFLPGQRDSVGFTYPKQGQATPRLSQTECATTNDTTRGSRRPPAGGG